MKVKNGFVLIGIAMLCALGGVADAPQREFSDSLAWVSSRLSRVLNYYPDDLIHHDEVPSVPGLEPDTWDGFLGGDDTNGMSRLEKRAAFDTYLAALGSADLLASKTNMVDALAVGGFSAPEVETAVAMCDVLSHTNAWPFLKALALNPRGIAREHAIALTVKFGPVDDEMTRFVEDIITNSTDWSRIARGASACGGYTERLLNLAPTNAIQRLSKERAIQMFYRHRNDGSAGVASMDGLFASCVDGYRISSNRLETVLLAIGDNECNDLTRRYLITVTNELLSSSQPLRQLNIGENGE